MLTSRDTGRCTIEMLDTENMGIAVEILLLCALEFEICLGVKIPPVAGERRKKPLPGQGLKELLSIAHFISHEFDISNFSASNTTLSTL